MKDDFSSHPFGVLVLAGIFLALVSSGLALIFTPLGLNVLAYSRKESKLRETDVWLGFVLEKKIP